MEKIKTIEDLRKECGIATNNMTLDATLLDDVIRFLVFLLDVSEDMSGEDYSWAFNIIYRCLCETRTSLEEMMCELKMIAKQEIPISWNKIVNRIEAENKILGSMLKDMKFVSYDNGVINLISPEGKFNYFSNYENLRTLTTVVENFIKKQVSIKIERDHES